MTNVTVYSVQKHQIAVDEEGLLSIIGALKTLPEQDQENAVMYSIEGTDKEPQVFVDKDFWQRITEELSMGAAILDIADIDVKAKNANHRTRPNCTRR